MISRVWHCFFFSFSSFFGGFSAPRLSIVISTAAEFPSSLCFRWVTMRAVSVWHSCTWTMHHGTGTSLQKLCAWNIQPSAALWGETKHSFTRYDSSCWHTHIIPSPILQLIPDDWLTPWCTSHSPNTKLSGLNSCPNGPERTESMVPGSRSTRMARGTNLLPLDQKEQRIEGQREVKDGRVE